MTNRIQSTFRPPLLLRNSHIQTTLASLKPRKLLTRSRAKALLTAASPVLLDCGDEVRLLGSYSARDVNARGLVIFIHGWEGSINSAYVLSAASFLFNRGFNIFRLNLRDHGDSHHLNREPFTSTRLTEAVNAILQVLSRFPHTRNFLTGFSLGGNFVLRIGMRLPVHKMAVDKIVAICPLIDPLSATRYMQQAHPVYHRYFVKKWKKSLSRKLDLFPDLGYGKALFEHDDLATMHDYFVPHHTSYPTAVDYLSAYKIKNEQLSGLHIPTHIIAANDDPITRKVDMDTLNPSGNITIEQTNYGGHCGFLQDMRLTSWVDQRLEQLFEGEGG